MPIWQNTYDMGGLLLAFQLESGEKIQARSSLLPSYHPP